METLEKTIITDDAREFFRLLPVDKDIESYKANLIDAKGFKTILILRNQFFYIMEISSLTNVYVSDSIKHVLGYEPFNFYNVDFVYKSIHPDDVDFVFAFSKKTILWSRNYCKELLQNPFAAVFSIDFRIRDNKGVYIRVNRQTSCFKTDYLGNMVYTISLFTDINHLKHSNLITYSWNAEVDMTFEMDELLKQYGNRVLSSREKEIIRHLSQGHSATVIGKKLFISTNTVIKHRKNILRKLQVKNTAELIRVAVETGVV